jgi:2-methylcitrate dehydratase PrpD
MPSYTQSLARWFSRLTLDDVPSDLVVHAKLRILDTLGVALAASSLEYGKVVRDAAQALGGDGGSRIVAFGDRVAPAWAAMANGMLAHALIFDDTHNESIVHPSSPLLSAALAVGEAVDCTGAEALTAFIGATELLCRIGLVAQGGFHKAGFQPTAIVGPVGAAYLASRLYGLDEAAMVHAAGLTASFASGVNESWTDGTWAQLLHPGWAAHSGVAAALLAKSGYSGPATALEGRFGLFKTHVQLPDFPFAWNRVLAGLGTEWESRRISFKPYPCAHVIHPFLDAILALHRDGLQAAEIQRVVCPIAEYMIRVVCEPVHEKRRPASDAQARTSLQYSLAEALGRGRLDALSYRPEALRDRSILEIADKIEYTVDATAPTSRQFKGWVIVHTKDGRVLERIEPFNRGSPDNPLAEVDVVHKFEANAALALDGTRVRDLLAIVMDLENQRSLASLMRACSR